MVGSPTRKALFSGAVLWLLISQLPLLCAQHIPLQLAAPTDAAISVGVFDGERYPAFAQSFQNLNASRLARYSIVLTNASPKDIVGVAIRWVTTDRNGMNRTTTMSFDSFGTSVAARQPIIRARTQLLATPNGFQQSIGGLSGGAVLGAVGRTGGIFGFGRGQLMRLEDLDESQNVTAVVDAVIFEDGRVIGTDESHLVDFINAIDKAAKTLAANLRADILAGRNVDEILKAITSQRRTLSVSTLQDDPGTFWTIREAEVLLRVFPAEQQRLQRLNQLEQFPPPPKFYR